LRLVNNKSDNCSFLIRLLLKWIAPFRFHCCLSVLRNPQVLTSLSLQAQSILLDDSHLQEMKVYSNFWNDQMAVCRTKKMPSLKISERFEVFTAVTMRNAVFWDIENPVRTSEEPRHASATKHDMLILCKIWGSHGSDHDYEKSSRRYVLPSSSGWQQSARQEQRKPKISTEARCKELIHDGGNISMVYKNEVHESGMWQGFWEKYEMARIQNEIP
jgi:hypothetical protein